MPPRVVRPIAICVFRHGGRILAGEGFDRNKGALFYRPLGGTIEFGERSEDTVRRELHEEIGAEVTDLRLLATLENIFEYEGQPGHEIVQVYDGRFVDESLYERESIQGYEVNIDEPFKAVWKRLEDFGPGKPPLYPDGLLEWLSASGDHPLNQPTASDGIESD
ncbi:MAG: NUDIX hydrolase [Chloroflexi bacterium]|nr:NUDIX hydrolase [Chloroflexota bacterium]